MFNLRDFVMETMTGMVGREPDYRVREYALGWYNRSELTKEDLAEIDALIVEHNTVVDIPVYPPIEEPEIPEATEPEPPVTDPVVDPEPVPDPVEPTTEPTV